ncbi:MAG: Flp family type IVb pilin [Halobacteriovoraceae bacterium]|jgi:pilus assembly protein Flp/PilA|nr:Flp family type IVb pilin [Halobacteriovoraceae bacterium]
MVREFINYLKDEDGQTSTEYILLVAVVAVIIIKFKDKLETKLNGLLDGVFDKANKELGGLQ